MDPDATWKEMLDAAAARDWAIAEERARALLDWIGKKGFPPTTSNQAGLPKSWHHAVTYRTCHLVLSWRKRPRGRRPA